MSLVRTLSKAEGAPAALSDAEYVQLLGADGDELAALCRLADEVRRSAVGAELTYVVNRNLDTGQVAGQHALVGDLVREAWSLGATEVCMQGPVPADAPAQEYLDLVRTITAAAPVHLHAYRAAEVADAAHRLDTTPREFLQEAAAAGLATVPGTAARILDDDVRARLAGGPDLPVQRWIELIGTAHEVGLRSTSTIVYGHVETPEQQVAHLRTLAEMQDRTGGFTELIAMPMTPEAMPAHLTGIARPGPSARETRALHAVARLLLHGRIDHIQAAWPKLGTELSRAVLAGGADDFGGLLLDGTRWPAAGAESGLQLSRAEIDSCAEQLGRRPRQRATDYGTPPVTGRLGTARDGANAAL
ncbi:FO synthase [Saccharopolyspora montiporae]|uniref:FO synthase n=1 Tax=Saccharopolyspora montiporae TaxID=2781240 RepID=UPI00351C1884